VPPRRSSTSAAIGSRSSASRRCSTAGHRGFRINWITGRFDRNQGYHYGIVRPMRDPQMLSNKTLSQVLHIINTNAKGGLIIEQGAFRNPKDAEKDWSTRPRRSSSTKADSTRSRTARTRRNLSCTRPASGVQPVVDPRRDRRIVEMLGLADREQAASLEYQRRQSAMTILASLFNGLRHYRKLQGRTMLQQLKLLPPGVLVRVLIDPEQAMAMFQQQMMQWQQAAQQAQQQGQQPPPQPEPPGAEFMSTTKTGRSSTLPSSD
jgi:hypothetical protein